LSVPAPSASPESRTAGTGVSAPAPPCARDTDVGRDAPCLDGGVRALCAPREPGRWGQSGGGASPASEFGRYVNLSPDCRSYRPDAILYLLAQPLLDLASDHLMRDRDLTTRYEDRFEVEDSDEWTAAMAEYNREADAITAALLRARGEPGLASLYLTNRRAFDRRMERGRQHFFGPPSGAHAAYLRSKGIID